MDPVVRTRVDPVAFAIDPVVSDGCYNSERSTAPLFAVATKAYCAASKLSPL